MPVIIRAFFLLYVRFPGVFFFKLLALLASLLPTFIKLQHPASKLAGFIRRKICLQSCRQRRAERNI